MSRYVFVIIIACLIGQTSCKDKNNNLEPLDLLSYGLPLSIMTPPDVVTVTNDLGIMRDVTVKNDAGYSIQIFESEARQLDPTRVKEELKSEVEESKFFSRMISEDNDGFIYEKKVDEDYINYDFRDIRILGDKQYIIQSGLSGQYTLEQVQLMYESVQ